MPVGQDSLDWKKIFTAAKTAGIRNYFVEMNLDMMKTRVPTFTLYRSDQPGFRSARHPSRLPRVALSVYLHGPPPLAIHYCVGNPENFATKPSPLPWYAVWNAPGVVGKLVA
jgi:hypothetical protein